MTLDEYQHKANETAKYPQVCRTENDALFYVTIALAGEVGEFCNDVKKHIRDGHDEIDPERHKKLVLELGDCLWYLSEAARRLGVSLQQVAQTNLAKLHLRYAN